MWRRNLAFRCCRATKGDENDGAVWVYASVCECLLDGRLSKPIKKTSRLAFLIGRLLQWWKQIRWWTVVGHFQDSSLAGISLTDPGHVQNVEFGSQGASQLQGTEVHRGSQSRPLRTRTLMEGQWTTPV